MRGLVNFIKENNVVDEGLFDWIKDLFNSLFGKNSNGDKIIDIPEKKFNSSNIKYDIYVRSIANDKFAEIVNTPLKNGIEPFKRIKRLLADSNEYVSDKHIILFKNKHLIGVCCKHHIKGSGDPDELIIKLITDVLTEVDVIRVEKNVKELITMGKEHHDDDESDTTNYDDNNLPIEDENIKTNFIKSKEEDPTQV